MKGANIVDAFLRTSSIVLFTFVAINTDAAFFVDLQNKANIARTLEAANGVHAFATWTWIFLGGAFIHINAFAFSVNFKAFSTVTLVRSLLIDANGIRSAFVTS